MYHNCLGQNSDSFLQKFQGRGLVDIPRVVDRSNQSRSLHNLLVDGLERGTTRDVHQSPIVGGFCVMHWMLSVADRRSQISLISSSLSEVLANR